MPPLKSVSVTPIKRGGGRKQPSPTLDHPDDDAVPFVSTTMARPARRAVAPMTHRYRVGERLVMVGGGFSVQRAASGCKVMALLPYEGRGALLYRVRSESEAFERIVAEGDLQRP